MRAGKEAMLLLEGERLIADAIAGGHQLDTVLVREDKPDWLERFPAAHQRLVEPALLDGVSALETSPGVLALAPKLEPRRLNQIDLSSNALVLVACGVSDPGNLGALARSAEAAGAEALVLVGGARPFGEKALRGSMGSLLRLPVVEAKEEDVARSLEGFRWVAAATRGGAAPDGFDWSGRLALWITGETRGLPEVAAEAEPVTLPMAGAVESLNVTVAASLLLFAAGRNA